MDPRLLQHVSKPLPPLLASLHIVCVSDVLISNFAARQGSWVSDRGVTSSDHLLH